MKMDDSVKITKLSSENNLLAIVEISNEGNS